MTRFRWLLVSVLCLVVLGAACSSDEHADLSGLPTAVSGGSLVLAEVGELSEASDQPTARIDLRETTAGVRFGIGRLAGDKSVDLLKDAIADQRVQGNIVAGRVQTANRPIAIALDTGGGADEGKFAIGADEDAELVVSAISNSGESESVLDRSRKIASADVTLLLYGSLTREGPGCIASFTGEGTSLRVAFSESGDPGPVFQWWFGGDARAVEVGAASAVASGGNSQSAVVAWRASESRAGTAVATGMTMEAAVDATGEIQLAVARAQEGSCLG